ncbi:unnamed protein product [Paramecium octaurelia]|uniref:Transmembrane protein n=1 Tax=Paramecium octaurelia TaxID=43137 RepID=A0A8S1WJB9_PAROT|nr:unnamed protein product [Paramecium octaurelia]
MRIGPIKIKLKPLLVYTPLICAPLALFNWYEYRKLNLEFKHKEDEIVLQAQLKANKISDKSFPTVYFDPYNQFFMEMEDLQGQIKIFVFSDQSTYKRMYSTLQRHLSRFQANYFNIVAQKQFDSNLGVGNQKSTQILTIENQIENQVIVTYNNEIIFSDKLMERNDKQVQVIERQISKMIEKEFLSKIKF